MRERRTEEPAARTWSLHEAEIQALADSVLVRVRGAYPDASAESQRATAILWLRQAAERLESRG